MSRRTFWVWGLAGLGFAISGVFSGWLGLSRDRVVLLYALLGGPAILAFFRWGPVSLRDHLRRNWLRGILAGLALGMLLAVSVMQQPPSRVPSGLYLGAAVIWLGVVYGLLDALLLTVIPVLAVYGRATPGLSGTGGATRGALAFLASLFITAAYHVGYEEFRGLQLRQPLIGNTILTVGYLVTGSVATPLIGHIIMHSAAVLHGMETASQLPPHYSRTPE
jgi:hypothetical protein